MTSRCINVLRRFISLTFSSSSSSAVSTCKEPVFIAPSPAMALFAWPNRGRLRVVLVFLPFSDLLLETIVVCTLSLFSIYLFELSPYSPSAASSIDSLSRSYRCFNWLRKFAERTFFSFDFLFWGSCLMPTLG